MLKNLKFYLVIYNANYDEKLIKERIEVYF